MKKRFKFSLLSKSCLLALTASGASPMVMADTSPWTASGGAVVDVTGGYTSTTAGDYPLSVTGAGSLLRSASAQAFRTTGDFIYGASVTNQGTLDLTNGRINTNGNLAHGINANSGTVKLMGGTVTTAGSNSIGINATSGSTLNLGNNLAISAQGDSNIAIKLADGTLNADGLSIAGSGTDSVGISLAYGTNGTTANATLNDVNIIMTGGGGALQLGNGSVTGENVVLSTTGTGRGVEVYNASGGRGDITLNDSDISTENGDGVYLLLGDATLNNTTINSQNGIGVNVNKTAKATLDGGSITTQGNNALGLWVATADSSADVTGTSITTHGTLAHAFDAQYGPAKISDSTLTTSGIGSYGLYTESTVAADHLTVDTQGSSAIGIYAARGGVVNLDTASINTTGSTAAAILADDGSTVNASHVTATTSGDNGFGLWTNSGTLNISDSSLTTSGLAAGLYVGRGSSGATSNVTLDNVNLDSQIGPAAQVTGANANITLKNGTQLNGGDMLAVGAIGGSNVQLSADNHVGLKGDIYADSGSITDSTLSNSSLLNGAVINGNSMNIDSSSVWQLARNSDVKSLNSSGLVDFQQGGSDYRTLSLENLAGNGSFAMKTDIAALQGDLITVSNSATGNHLIAVKNSGLDPADGNGVLPLVKTSGSGDEQFTLKNGVVDAGTYQYQLEHRGGDWVLAQKTTAPGNPDPGTGTPGTPDPGTGTPGEIDPGTGTPGDGSPGTPPDGGKPVLTPSAATALGIFNAMPSAWYGELTTLRTRLGDVRLGKQEGGAWVRAIGGQLKMHDANGEGYSQNQSGISVGVDSALDIGDNSQMLLGVFSGYSRSNLQFTRNSSGTIDSFFIGGYSTFLLQDGWFIDNVLKANNFSSHANARMSDGTRADGGYSTPGLGLSVELGRRIDFKDGWFAEPSAQISTVWMKGSDYRLSNGLEADSNQASSKQGALHLVLGRTLELQNGIQIQPWVRASLIEEFAKSNKVNINNNSFNNDMSGLRGEYTLGTSAQVTKDLQIYTEASYSKGEKIETPWGASLGLRWSW